MPREKSVRAFLAAKLGHTPREDVLRVLQLDDYIDGDAWAKDYTEDDGLIKVSSVLNRYKNVAATLSAAREKTPVERDAHTDARATLLSKLVAVAAAQLPQVKRFRAEYLPDGLLPIEQVESWVTAQAAKDGPPTLWVELPIAAKQIVTDYDTLIDGFPKETLAPPVTVETLPTKGRQEYRTLMYPGSDGWARTLKTAQHGVLDSLRIIGESLARRFHWQEAAATRFILTGIPALIPSVRVKVERGAADLPTFTYHRTRIVLDIDAETPPAKVAEIYAEARRQVRTGKRNRPLEAKMTALVGFVADCDARATWHERLTAWNRAYPQWAYTSEQMMLAKYHRATKKLLGE